MFGPWTPSNTTGSTRSTADPRRVRFPVSNRSVSAHHSFLTRYALLDNVHPGNWKTLGSTLLVVVGLVGVTVSMTVPTVVCTETVASGETASSSCSADGAAWLGTAVGFVLGIACTLGGGWGVRRTSDDAGAYTGVVSGGVLVLVGLFVGVIFGGWFWNLLTADPWVTEGMPLYSWIVLACLAGTGVAVAGFGARILVGATRSSVGR